MAQLSRPFQIALVAVVLLAAVWFFALQGHPTSTSSSASSSSVPSASAPASSSAAHGSETLAQSEAKAAAAPTHVYHGSAPGVEGLTRAINKAHGAVATSQSNAKQLEGKSAQASGESATANGSSTGAATRSAAPATHSSSATNPAAKSSTSSSSASVATSVTQKPTTSKSDTAGKPAKQALVERALKEGKIAVILFWNPEGTDDVAVNGELRLLEAVHHLIRPVANEPKVHKALERSGMELQKSFAAFQASANEVSAFGSITRDVQISATPTIVVVNRHGRASVLTGLQDAFSIEQAIDEARNAS
ncbi:MAG TPA: hypothetical protein VK272_07050 [Solirubrobacteraceae bacterium]|nr:hypothetical protein [Solirubrobacteraceae bacterium]